MPREWDWCRKQAFTGGRQCVAESGDGPWIQEA